MCEARNIHGSQAVSVRLFEAGLFVHVRTDVSVLFVLNLKLAPLLRSSSGIRLEVSRNNLLK